MNYLDVRNALTSEYYMLTIRVCVFKLFLSGDV